MIFPDTETRGQVYPTCAIVHGILKDSSVINATGFIALLPLNIGHPEVL